MRIGFTVFGNRVYNNGVKLCYGPSIVFFVYLWVIL